MQRYGTMYQINEDDLADECQKMLDNGWTIQLYRNSLGSYTAAAIHPRAQEMLNEAGPFGEVDDEIEELLDNDRFITDDFTPSKALRRLTEKAIFGRILGSDD